MSDDLARLRAITDQTRETLKEVSAELWTFFESLTRQGFKRNEALHLTQAFFVEQLRSGGAKQDD